MSVVHRCRFLEYQPQAIHCLAFEHPQRPSTHRLAVSRSDGDIEIWNVSNDFHLERRIPGGEGSSVEALVWRNGRLFSAGLHAQVIEWDVDRLVPKFVVDSFGGPVWSLAVNPSGTLLAAGCEDGCIRVYDLSENSLEYKRVWDKQEGRILSMAWGSDDQGNEAFVSGGSDGTIRVWNPASGRCKLRISLQGSGKKDAGASSSTLVWSLLLLQPEGSPLTVVSGDSTGHVQFWNVKTGALRQSFSTHSADVMGLAATAAQDTVFATGVDTKVAEFRYIEGGHKDKRAKTWVASGKAREHTHDVRAIALSPSDDVIVTGGVDTNLVMYPTTNFGLPGTSYRKVPPFPQQSPVTVATERPVLLFENRTSLELWQLGDSSEALSAGEMSGLPNGHKLKHATGPCKLVQIEPKTGHHITAATMSADGTRVAYSNALGVKLLDVQYEDDEDAVSVMRVKSPRDSLPMCHALAFTPDGRRLVMLDIDMFVHVWDTEHATVESIPPPPPAEDDGTDGTLGRVALVAVSSDGQFVAVTGTRRIHVYSLDTLQYVHTLPAFPTQHTAIAFRPGTMELVTTTVDNRVYIFDVEERTFTHWHRENSESLPYSFLRRKEKIIAIAFNPRNSNSLVLIDNAGFVALYLDRPLPDRNVSLFDYHEKSVGKTKHERGHKRKTEENASGAKDKDEESTPKVKGANMIGVMRYRPLLSVGFGVSGSLVVVERPWLSILESFPEPLYRSRYGT